MNNNAPRKHRQELDSTRVNERTSDPGTTGEALREPGLLLQLTHDAIIVRAYSDAEIKFWNRGAADLYGWAEEEALGKVIHELLRSKYPEPLNDIVEKVTRFGRWEGELTHTTKDGIELVVDSRWSLVRDVDEKPVNIIEINSDITERKHAELRAQENQRLAELGTAAAMFAHEVANPLNGISTCLQLVSSELGKKEDQDSSLLADLHFAEEEIRRLGKLLNEFRSLAQPLALNLRPANLAQAVDAVIVPELSSGKAAGIGVERDIGETPSRILMDEDRMKQVILYLCRNAIEAMPEGGILKVRCYQSGDRGILEISDTGVGIPKDSDIFQLFTTTKSAGTGLGLAVVRQIVAAHSGEIEYISEPGKGTTFRIALPLSNDL